MGGRTYRPRVLLVQRILPHYRLKLFEALAASHTFRIDFAYGGASRGSTVESTVAPASLRVAPLRNLYLGRHETLSYQAGLVSLLRRERYDVVIAEFNPRILSNMMACLRPNRRERFIWWGHGMGSRAGSIAARVRTYLANLGDAVIFYDRKQAETLMSYGLPAHKAYVAPNSIDVAAIQQLRADSSFESRRDILFIGRLIPTKRVDVLIRAYALARPALRRNSRLIIVGDGPERQALGALANTLGVGDAVQLVGAVNEQERLAEYFNSAWVSACAGYVGLNAIHCLAFGLPMIVTRDAKHAPEVAALRHGETAIFVERADVRQFADAIIELSQRGDEWTRMRRLCTALVDRDYGIETMVRVFERAILAGEDRTV